MAIFLTGDTHGDFSRLLPAAFHEQRDLTKEDYLILCGDFGGVWDGGDAEQQWLDWLETRSFTTLFVSGNHENYDLLRNYPISQWHGGLVLNEIRFSNIFIEKRISSCSQSLEKSRLFSFAPLMREGENSRNAKLILLHKVAI